MAPVPGETQPAGLGQTNPDSSPAGEIPPEPAKPQDEAAARQLVWTVADQQEVAVDKLGMDLHFFHKGGLPHLRIEPRGDQHGAWHGVFALDGSFVGEDVEN